MKHSVHTVEDAGLVIRAMRKHSNVRIDDFALTAKVSKQFMTDVENGKPSVQMGRVLALLKGLGVRVVLEFPDAVAPSLQREAARRSRKTAAQTEPTKDPDSHA